MTMKNLKTFVDENLDIVKEELEEIISECIPDIVNSYNWQDDDDDGIESNEYDWYDSYSHTTGYQAEYEGALRTETHHRR